MGSFGEKLREAREARGVSLDEIAKSTKIGTRSLKALEDENFEILPGGIFNKGFVRAYARFLGMNEEEAIAAYQAAVKEEPVSVKTIAAQSAMARASHLAAQQARESSYAKPLIRDAAIILLAIAMMFVAYVSYRRGYIHALKLPHLHSSAKMQADATKPESTASAIPAATAPQTPTAISPQSSTVSSVPQGEPPLAGDAAPVAGAFTVSIKTTEESWLSVTADGKRAFQRILEPEEQQSVTAQTGIRIVIGNPYGTQLSLNGKPLVIAGDLDRPRTVLIDANGMAAK